MEEKHKDAEVPAKEENEMESRPSSRAVRSKVASAGKHPSQLAHSVQLDERNQHGADGVRSANAGDSDFTLFKSLRRWVRAATVVYTAVVVIATIAGLISFYQQQVQIAELQRSVDKSKEELEEAVQNANKYFLDRLEKIEETRNAGYLRFINDISEMCGLKTPPPPPPSRANKND